MSPRVFHLKKCGWCGIVFDPRKSGFIVAAYWGQLNYFCCEQEREWFRTVRDLQQKAIKTGTLSVQLRTQLALDAFLQQHPRAQHISLIQKLNESILHDLRVEHID